MQNQTSSSHETIDYWPGQVILICLYSSIAVVSFVLNSLTIAVLLKYDTKIYSELNVYLINQSVSDIVMSLLCIPFTYTNFILNRWIFPNFLCPVVHFVQICSVLVSIWNLTLIGIERYLVIVVSQSNQTSKHLSIKKHNQLNNWKKLVSIGAIWFFGIISGCVQLIYTRVVPVEYGNYTQFECKETLTEENTQLYTIYLFVNTFALPSLILLYVYSVIGYRMWRHVRAVTPIQSDQQQQQVQLLSRNHNHMRKVAKMMLLIVLLFILSWFPLHIYTLLAIFKDTFLQIRSIRDYHQLVYGYLVCHLLAMSHSFMNPLVYCCISRKFSQNFCTLTHRFVNQLSCCFGTANKINEPSGGSALIRMKKQNPL